jgi:hypothetical protein
MKYNYLLKLAESFYKFAESYDCYWIRPDGTYISGESHERIGIKELTRIGIKINDLSLDSLSKMYEELYNLNYIRAAVGKVSLEFQTQFILLNFKIPKSLLALENPNAKSLITDFILENHLENRKTVEIDSAHGSKEYTMEDFLNI